MNDQVTVTLPVPGANATATNTNTNTNDSSRQQYPINALRQSSSYFDAMLSSRWLESHHNDNECQNSDNGVDVDVFPVVDLSQSGLDPRACASILQFMVLRYSRTGGDKDDRCNCNDDSTLTQDHEGEVGVNKREETKHKNNITDVEEMNAMLWKGFQWDEEDSTVDCQKQQFSSSSLSPPSSQEAQSDEIILYRTIDYLHLQPHDEILTKLWAMKIVHSPRFLEDALKKQDLIGPTRDIKKLPGRYQREEQMWRFLVCMFICRMLVYEDEVGNGVGGDANCVGHDRIVDQNRAMHYQRRLDAYDAMSQLSYLCLGIGETPISLLTDMVDSGLLKREEDESEYYWQTSLDSQVMRLWDFMEG